MVLREGRLVTSYSQIDKFSKCPYNWELKYIDGIDIEVKSKHLEYGLAVHEILEHIYKTIQSNQNNFLIDTGMEEPKELDIDEIKSMFLQVLKEREVPFDSEEERTEWTNAGLDMIDSLLLKETEFSKMMLESEILGVELPFELPIEIMPVNIIDPETGEANTYDTVWIIGFIDLVLRTPEGIVIIDHKSGGKKFDKAKLRTDLQFPIYAMAIKHIYGELPVKAYYNFTRLGIYQEVKIAEVVTPEMEEKMDKRGAKEIYCLSPEDAEREIRQIFQKMSCSERPANPSPLCYWCDYGYHLYGICTKSSQWQPKKST